MFLSTICIIDIVMALWLRYWIPNPGVLNSKQLGGSKVDSAFYSSQVNQLSIRNFWEFSGKI